MVTLEQFICVFWFVVLVPGLVLAIASAFTMPHIDDPGMMPF